MTCQELDDRLDDWLDGSLAEPAAAAVEAHLAGCGDCREHARDLRRLLDHAAALPRSLSPGRELWPGIEARLAGSRGPVWLGAWAQPALLGLAAALALALAGVAWRLHARPVVSTAEMPAADSTESAAATTVAATLGDTAGDPVLAAAERDYEDAAGALLAALQQRKGRLDPETLAGVEANLQLIDRALREVRQALAQDPDNPGLSRMLAATHRKKLDVLQRVVRLSAAL